MTHDRSTGGDDTLFADLERELGGTESGTMNTAPSDDPLAELARLIEESRGGPAPAPSAPAARPQPAAQPQRPVAAAPQAPAAQQPPKAAPQSYGDDLAMGLEESLRGMDFSTEADPFAQPGDMSSDMMAPSAQPKQAAPAPQPHHAPAPQISAQPAESADDPFASLESALSRVVSDNGAGAPAAANPHQAYGASANPYAAHVSGHGHDAYAAVPEPGIQYDEGAPEFADAEEGASPYDDAGYEYEDSPRSSRGVYVVGALIGLVVVGGAAAYGFKSFMGGSEDVPLVQASDVPAKTIPEQSAQQPAQQGKLVYDRIGGNGDDTANSQIMPREEQVAIGGDGRSVRVISGEGAPPAPASGAEGDDSRRVRTLTVRPDGQIETPPPPPPAPPAPTVAEQPAPQTTTAPAQLAPAPSPVATNTGRSQQPQSQLDVLRQNAQREAQSQGVPLPLTRPAPTAADNQQTQTPVAVAPTQIPQAPLAVQPQNQPNSVRIPRRGSDDAAAIVVGSQRQQPRAPAPAPTIQQQQSSIPVAVAPTQSAPAPQQTQVAAAPRQSAPRQAAAPITSGYVVQVASSRSEADAQSALARVQGQAAGALGGYRGQVQRADLGTRGIFYRAAFGPMQSSSEANSVCNKLKSSGIDCFVR